jgi:hypothetical protein
MFCFSLQCGFLGSFPFDPMGMRSEKTKLNELKNGRLAMLAFVGFCSQAAVRGLGPIDCLKLHLEDPWNNNSEWPVQHPASAGVVTPEMSVVRGS